MIRFIKTIHRAIKRRRHFQRGAARLAEVRPDVEKVCGGPVRFLQGKGGGHDFIYFVERDGRRTGVLRVANLAHVPEGTPQGKRLNGPRLKLTPCERVAREWRLCAAGWPHALTPQPLWRSAAGDAMLNSFLDGCRLFDCVREGRIALWDAIDRAAGRARVFHSVIGEAHMDLSLFNVYADDAIEALTLIDFELAPNPALSAVEARLFDILNLVEMAYKDMSAGDRRAAPGRLDRLFAEVAADDVKGAPVAKLAVKLPRILSDPAFREALSRHLVI
jgi:hypothetical protein